MHVMQAALCQDQPTLEDLARLVNPTVSVSNWPSGRDWELDQPSAVRVPPHVVQISWGHSVFISEGQRRVAFQQCVTACRIVVRLELGQLPFQITAIPEQHVVETFAPHRPAKRMGATATRAVQS